MFVYLLSLSFTKIANSSGNDLSGPDTVVFKVLDENSGNLPKKRETSELGCGWVTGVTMGCL